MKENNIPKHWQIKKLGEVCIKISLNNIKIKQKDYLVEGKYPVVDQGQELIGGYYNDEKLVIPNDPPYIIFGDHTRVKKFINFKFIAGADGVKVLKPDSILDSKFFFYLIHIVKIPDKGYARHFQFLEKEYIPIPPLPEQQAIVAKIEELFSELENGKQQLLTAQQQLKVYRQSLLKWAFEGKLTNQNVKEGELPKGWKIDKFNDFCKLQRGYDLPLMKIQKGEYPVVTSSGINGYHNEYKANGPCLITGRSGGVGNIHFVDILKYWPHNTVLFVKDFCGNVPKFVYYFFIQFNFKKFSASTTIPTLDRKHLFNELINVPTIYEQQIIVSELESKLTVCDKIQETISESLQQTETLKQSILKKAFEGKLI